MTLRTHIIGDDDVTEIQVHGAVHPPRLPEDCWQVDVDDALVDGRPHRLTESEQRRAEAALLSAHDHQVRCWWEEDLIAAWEANHAD